MYIPVCSFKTFKIQTQSKILLYICYSIIVAYTEEYEFHVSYIELKYS